MRARRRAVNRDELFLPQGYSENQPEPVDTEDGLDYWAREAEVRSRSARRRASSHACCS